MQKKKREKANPTNLNRDLGQGRRGARHEKKSLHFSWGQERRGGGGREEREAASV